MAASSFTCHDTSPLRGERTGIQSYKERGLLSGHLGTVPVNSARKTPHLPGEGGVGGRTGTYFPRAKHSSLAVPPLAVETVSGNCTSILGSYSPITPANRKKDLSLGAAVAMYTCPVHAAPHCVYSSRLRVKRATSPTAGSHGCCPSESLRGEMCVTVPPHPPRSRFSDTLCSGSHAKIKNKRGIKSQAGKPHLLFF